MDTDQSHPSSAETNGAAATGQSRPQPKLRRPCADAALALLPEFLQACAYSSQSRKAEILDRMLATIEPRNPTLARRIRKSMPLNFRELPAMPSDILRQSEPRHSLDTVVLDATVRTELDALLVEHGRAEELRRYHLNPRHRLLLSGPPGNGKTLVAEAMAHELGLTFLSVSYGALIDSKMGGTGRNIETIFNFVAGVPCVLFFDEFDGVGASRTDGNEVREFRRVTNQLLVCLDRLPPNCVMIAATNAEELIDAALIRRFDTRLTIAAPSHDLRRQCAALQLRTELTPGVDLTHLIDRIANGAFENLNDLTDFCLNVRRHAALHGADGVERVFEARQAVFGQPGKPLRPAS